MTNNLSKILSQILSQILSHLQINTACTKVNFYTNHVEETMYINLILFKLYVSRESGSFFFDIWKEDFETFIRLGRLQAIISPSWREHKLWQDYLAKNKSKQQN